MSSQAAVDRLKEVVDDAAASGARLHAGGGAGGGGGAYYAPTELSGITPEMRAYREELFGPVAVVYAVASDEAALALANDSGYGRSATRVAARDRCLGRTEVARPAGQLDR